MKRIISKFTMGKPKQMLRPTAWLFWENIFMTAPAVAIYFAINILAAAFEQPEAVDIGGLWKIAAVLLGILSIQYLLSLGAYLNTFLPATRNSAENKSDFVKKLRSLPLGYFLKKKSGELINTFTGDFLAIEQSMVGMFTGMFSVILGCVLTSVFMFIFNPVMALALYASIPVAVVIVIISMKLMARCARKNLEAKDNAATYLNEYLLGMKTLKGYNQTGESFGKLKEAYKRLMEANIKAESVGGSLINFTVSLVHMGLPLMCFAGAYLILGGTLNVVDYLALIIIGTKILSPLITWVRYMVVLRIHYVSATRISNVMEQPGMPGSGTVEEYGDINFDHVHFTYDGKNEPALEDVTISIPKDKLTAIVGPSGSGKTTVLRLVARFWDVSGGNITCAGKALSELDADAWMENISMVFQDVYLFHETIRENIMFGRKDATEAEMVDAAKRAGCHDFIMELPEQYDTLVGEGGCTLSGGEKQRISIARAILKDAPILLLDEPTASLDARNEVTIQHAISELVEGRTVIMIAHRLKTIQNAHQIIVLEDGKVKECGTHRALLAKKGLYEYLWSMQNQARDWNIRK